MKIAKPNCEVSEERSQAYHLEEDDAHEDRVEGHDHKVGKAPGALLDAPHVLGDEVNHLRAPRLVQPELADLQHRLKDEGLDCVLHEDQVVVDVEVVVVRDHDRHEQRENECAEQHHSPRGARLCILCMRLCEQSKNAQRVS